MIRGGSACVCVAWIVGGGCIRRDLDLGRFACGEVACASADGGAASPDADIPDGGSPSPYVRSSSTALGFGDGRDGPLIVPPDTISEVPLSSLKLAEDAPSGATVLKVQDTPSYAPGDLALVLVMRSGTPTLVGQWDVIEVASVEGTTIHLRWGLGHAYAAHDEVLVQRVPQYSSVSIGAESALTAPAWNGTRGGVLALAVAGALEVEASATITMRGRGYRGGTAGGQARQHRPPLTGEGASPLRPAGGGRAFTGGAGGGGGNRESGEASQSGAPGGLAFAAGSGDGLTLGGGGGGGTLMGTLDPRLELFDGARGGGAIFVLASDARGLRGTMDASGANAHGPEASSFSGKLSGAGAGGTVLLVSPHLPAELEANQEGVLDGAGGSATCDTRQIPELSPRDGCAFPPPEVLLCMEASAVTFDAEVAAIGDYRLDVELAGTFTSDQDPRLGVLVDGVRVGQLEATVTHPRWGVATLPLHFAEPGQRHFELVFENKYADEFGDRALYLRNVTLSGPAGPGCSSPFPRIRATGGLGGATTVERDEGGDGGSGIIFVRTTNPAHSTATCIGSCQPQLPASVVHRWRFADDTTDVVGGADAVLMGNATVGDGALQLDGTGSYATLPITTTLAHLTSVTFEAWVKLDVDPWTQVGARVFDFGTGETVNMFLTVASQAGKPQFGITVGGSATAQVVDGTALLSTRAPVHLVVVHDGTALETHLYLEGLEVDRLSNATLDPHALGPLTRLWLGHSQYAGAPDLHGSILDFRIHETALSPEGVEESYELGPDL